MNLRTCLRWSLLAGALLWAPVAPALNYQQHFVSWGDLDAFVAGDYASLTNDAPCFPPGPFQFGLDGGLFSFAPDGDLAAATNAYTSISILGIQAYAITIVETQGASRVWLYENTTGAPFRTNDVPAGFDPQQWVRSAFLHDPPGTLSGEDLALWYSDRDRSRISLRLTLVNSNNWSALMAAEEAAATNNPSSGAPPPRLPLDTNTMAFVGITAGSSNVLWVYTPSNRPVDILSRATLTMTTNAWSLLGTFDAVTPFNLWNFTRGASATVFMAGFSDVDSDADGIPDLFEIYLFGTDRNNDDSDRDGISDFNEIYVFGTDPNNPDITVPAVTITAPPNNFTQVWLP